MEEFQCWRAIVDEFKVKTTTLTKFGLNIDEINSYIPVATVPTSSKSMPHIQILDQLISYNHDQMIESNNSWSLIESDMIMSSKFEELESTTEEIVFSSCGISKQDHLDTSMTSPLKDRIYNLSSENDLFVSPDDKETILPVLNFDSVISVVDSDLILSSES